MRTISLRVRESFWFLPAVLGIAAIVLAQVLVTIDRTLVDRGTPLVVLDALSASGGRSILTTIGTSMLTVAGTSFSITISVLATTSSTYGPRLVRNFMADRSNQFVLAAFTATFLYSIVVLRSVHTDVDDGSAFVPVIAIHAAVLLGVLDVAVLVFFIHHIASSVQITSLQQQVQDDLDAAVGLAFRTSDDESVSVAPGPVSTPGHVSEPEGAVRAEDHGHVQSVDWPRLVRWASEQDRVVVMTVMPGDYVIQGDPVLRITDRSGGEVTVDDADRTRLRAMVLLGVARTPYQDVDFALQQLVEIAVRGLASGTNDPYTAATALDMSARTLVPLWRDRAPITAYLQDGSTCVVPRWPSAESLVDSVFAGVRTYGMDHPIVTTAALRLAHRLEEVARPDRRGHLGPVIDELRAAAH